MNNPGAQDWNVVVTIYDDSFRGARKFLREFGDVNPTDYRNVLVLSVPDVEAFIRMLSERVTAQPGLLNLISRVVPGTFTFDFQDPVEFDTRAKDALTQLTPGLVGKRFHVRIHRRGFKHRIVSPEEERHLNQIILEELAAKGARAEIAFDDPDVIVAIETVGQRACVSAWSREDLARYPFLRLD